MGLDESDRQRVVDRSMRVRWEREAQREDMEQETDPQVKAAKERAVEARAQADSANERAEEAEREAEKLELLKKIREGENLDAGDQGAIQGSTQTGIETIR